MWSRGVILLLTLTAAALAFDREVAKDRLTDFRVHSQNLHVDELEEEIGKLEEAFEKLSDPISDVEVSQVKARVRKLAVQNCAKTEVSCGGDHPECVSNLLVCDGIKDCHNGHDEDELVCSPDIVHPGSSFRGTLHWSSCEESHDHPTIITITASHKSDFFGPRAWVRATITNEASGDFTSSSQKALSYTAKGWFAFGNRKLALIPLKGSPFRYGIICEFTFGDNDHAACRVVQEGSLNVCARMRVVRK
jgi:hypothetical protein